MPPPTHCAWLQGACRALPPLTSASRQTGRENSLPRFSSAKTTFANEVARGGERQRHESQVERRTEGEKEKEADQGRLTAPRSAATMGIMRHEHRLMVQSYECDANGHVNNAVYLNYLESARVAFLRAAGASYRDLRDKGYSLVVVRVCIDFRGEAYMEDPLVVVTEPVKKRLDRKSVV